MSSDWNAIYPDVDGRPVRARSASFRSIANSADLTGEFVADVSRDFLAFSRLEHERFSGEAINALSETISEVSTSLAGVEPLFRDLASILRRHADSVDRYRKQASVALAQARAAWRDRRDAEGRRDDADIRRSSAGSRLSNAEQQLRHWTHSLATTSPEDAGYFVIRDRVGVWRDAVYEHRREVTEAEQQHATASRQVESASAQLEHWRRGPRNHQSWQALREKEDALNKKTSQAIESLELGGLANPSKLRQLANAVASFTGAEDYARAIKALFRGDFEAMREHVKQYTMKALRLAAIVAAIAAVVLAVIYLGPALSAFIAAHPTLALAVTTWEIGSTVGTVFEVGALSFMASKQENPAARQVLQSEASSKLRAKLLTLGVGKVISMPKYVSPLLPKDQAARTAFDAWDSATGLKQPAPEPKVLVVPPDIPQARSPEELIARQRTLTVTTVPSDLGQLKPYVCGVGGGR